MSQPRDDFLMRPDGGPGRRSTQADAAIIKGMLVRGDPIQDIAAHYGCNSGRIAETKRPYVRGFRSYRPRYENVPPAPLSELPPAGPPLAQEKAINVQVVGVAKEFFQLLQNMDQKMDQMQMQLANFGRQVGLIENPKFPRITKARPLGS